MNNFGIKLLDLVERSVIVQALVTLGLVGVAGYLYVTGKPVPESLLSALYLVLGFWFGTKMQHSIDENRKARGL